MTHQAEADALLVRYLRQTAELGGNELYLDTLTPAEFTEGLRARILEGLMRRDGIEAAPATATEDLIVVAEALGDAEGIRERKLLDLLFVSAGLPRNVKFYSLRDVAKLDGIAPRVFLAVGDVAAQALVDSEESIGRLRGTTHIYRNTPLIVTYHPAYLLRSPQMMRAAWDDFQAVRKVLDGQV